MNALHESRTAKAPREAHLTALQYRWAAADLRRSGLFDERHYALSAAARLAKMDPAVHYLRSGEAQGYAPSKRFDPVYYREANPDIAAAGVNCLHHYICHGQAEGRAPLPFAYHLDLPTRRLKEGRRNIVLIAHDASRTGAPILAWNIGRELSKRCNVVVILAQGGPIEEAFDEFAAAVIKPPKGLRFNPGEAMYLADRLVETYSPAYAIANSVETRDLVPALARALVPVVALVHEFSGYTRPVGVLNQFFSLSSNVVFASKLLANSSIEDYPVLKTRQLTVLPQGPSALPAERNPVGKKTTAWSKPKRFSKRLLVVGMGTVHIRKGVDLFIAVAAEVRRQAPDADILFAWVGRGYRPADDVEYSVYLAEQAKRSDVAENVVFVDEVGDLDPIYAQSDLFLLSSRLDPLPNVTIDAMLRGIPVVCFENATGLAEILADDPATGCLVVPHMDITAAARRIVQLESNRSQLNALSRAVKQRAHMTFDMERYVKALDSLGHASAFDKEAIETDRLTISMHEGFNAQLYAGRNVKGRSESAALADYLLQFRLLQQKSLAVPNVYLRRPLEGFHPLSYANECPEYEDGTREDPLAHYLRLGRPKGPWNHPVIYPANDDIAPRAAPGTRVALHGHFHYPELLSDLLRRLAVNHSRCDLFLTSESVKSQELREAARGYRKGAVHIVAVPNRGRDIGPFFTQLKNHLVGKYDIVGHVHSKRSAADGNRQMGERWREFLWEHLIGSKFPMVDVIVEHFSADATMGLVFAEDPNLVGWDENREQAERLAAEIGLSDKLPTHFDFPVGTMFWARTDALRPLFDRGLTWRDYPEEPVPRDATILHAIERLLPFVARHAGYSYATTYIDTVTR